MPPAAPSGSALAGGVGGTGDSISHDDSQDPQQQRQDDGTAAPLREIFQLYDIVCTADADEEEQWAAEAAAVRQQEREERAEQHGRQQRAAASEGSIMVNFMPLVRTDREWIGGEVWG